MLQNIGIKKSSILYTSEHNAVWLLINGFSILTSISLSEHHALSSPLPKYVNDVTSTMKFMFKY